MVLEEYMVDIRMKLILSLITKVNSRARPYKTQKNSITKT